MYGLGAAAVGGAIWLVMSRYHVAAPTEYIVRTGLFIPEISIAKKAFRWPLQRAFVLDITPTSYSFTAGAMTSEKLAFHLPMSFTIGPRDDPEALQRYARFLMHSEGSGPVVAGKGVSSTTKLEQLVKGIIEGETRVLAASMTVDQIFGDRVALKERIVGVSFRVGGFMVSESPPPAKETGEQVAARCCLNCSLCRHQYKVFPPCLSLSSSS